MLYCSFSLHRALARRFSARKARSIVLWLYGSFQSAHGKVPPQSGRLHECTEALRLNRPFRRSIYLLNHLLPLVLPVSDAAKLSRFVARLDEFFSGARRAPSTLSIENERDILGDVLHSFVEFIHGNVDGAGNGAVPFQLPVLADIDQ